MSNATCCWCGRGFSFSVTPLWNPAMLSRVTAKNVRDVFWDQRWWTSKQWRSTDVMRHAMTIMMTTVTNDVLFDKVFRFTHLSLCSLHQTSSVFGRVELAGAGMISAINVTRSCAVSNYASAKLQAAATLYLHSLTLCCYAVRRCSKTLQCN